MGNPKFVIQRSREQFYFHLAAGIRGLPRARHACDTGTPVASVGSCGQR